MKILIGGSGKMAKEMEAVCKRLGIPCLMVSGTFEKHLPEHIDLREEFVVVNFSSKRTLPDLKKVCLKYDIPLIHGSSQLVKWPSRMLVIEAPNLSIPVIQTLNILPGFVHGLDMTKRLVESHQASKKDHSATTNIIAQHAGVSQESIVSVRNEGLQMHMGVPKQHLGAHAYHYLTLENSDVEIGISIKVHGRATYAEGAIHIAKNILAKRKDLKPRVYKVGEIYKLLCQ